MRMAYSSRRLASVMVAMLGAVFSACASVRIDESSITLSDRLDTPTQRRRSYISADEIQATHASSTLEMIHVLRPEFLRASERASTARPSRPSVYLNQTYYGDASWLSTIALGEIRQVEFLHPVEAHARFGPMCLCDGGVLVVQTRPFSGAP
jgi:hypothetical protein